MKISAKSRYAVRILAELGKDRTRIHPLREIEAGQNISAKFAKQIMQPLESKKLIGSRRGSQGGYYLIRDPGSITLLDVLKITGEPVQAAPCSGHTEYCEIHNSCGASYFWAELEKKIRSYLSQVTIRDIIEKGDAV